MNRISRCTSRMWSRPVRAGSTFGALAFGVPVTVLAPNPLVAARAKRPPAVLRRRPVAGEQHAARRRVVMRAWSSARYSSSTVCGRKALRTSGRLNAIRTVPCSTARW